MNLTISRSYRLLGICMVWSLTISGPADAQEPDLRLTDRLSQRAVDSITVLTRRASTRALPLEPMIQKALEGHSKGATESLILGAVADLLSRLEEASSALGPDATDTELVAAAGAIHVGVSNETLRSVVSVYRDESLALPLVVLTDVIRKGVAVETASTVIMQLVEARIDLEGLQRFRRLVERDIDQGAVPAEAAMIRARGALLERRPGNPL